MSAEFDLPKGGDGCRPDALYRAAADMARIIARAALLGGALAVLFSLGRWGAPGGAATATEADRMLADWATLTAALARDAGASGTFLDLSGAALFLTAASAVAGLLFSRTLAGEWKMLLSAADLERLVRPVLATALSWYLGVVLAVSIAAAAAGRDVAAMSLPGGTSVALYVGLLVLAMYPVAVGAFVRTGIAGLRRTPADPVVP